MYYLTKLAKIESQIMEMTGLKYRTATVRNFSLFLLVTGQSLENFISYTSSDANYDLRNRDKVGYYLIGRHGNKNRWLVDLTV